MMNLRNCPECGRLFELVVRDLCTDCIEREEEDYALIKKFLRQNPGAEILEVSEKTGVSEKRVLQMIRSGRLIVDARINCERCGRPIDSGRFCGMCCASLGKSLERTVKPDDSPSPRQSAPYQSGSKADNTRFTKHFQK